MHHFEALQSLILYQFAQRTLEYSQRTASLPDPSSAALLSRVSTKVTRFILFSRRTPPTSPTASEFLLRRPDTGTPNVHFLLSDWNQAEFRVTPLLADESDPHRRVWGHTNALATVSHWETRLMMSAIIWPTLVAAAQHASPPTARPWC